MENYKHVLISSEIGELLKEYCEQTGRSQKGLVEYLIKEHLKKNKHE